MKLIICRSCGEVLSLDETPRNCACGKSGGRYVGDLDAVYWGSATPLAFHNHSFRDALSRQPELDEPPGLGGIRFDAFVVPRVTRTFREAGEYPRPDRDDDDPRSLVADIERARNFLNAAGGDSAEEKAKVARQNIILDAMKKAMELAACRREGAGP